MALSPNSAQSRELTELRNHLKWLDEERRKTAHKLGDMEQRIAQQGREITEREKRIHELEWQIAQLSERVEQVPENGAGSSGQEQRLQDLEWHMSNINAQLVRLPKLDEELNRFREDIAQSTVDIENRLAAQQTATSEHLENNVYARLREDITQSGADYDNRLLTTQNELLDRLAVTETTLGEQIDRQVAIAIEGSNEPVLARLAALEAIGGDGFAEYRSNIEANQKQIAELSALVGASQASQEGYGAALDEMKGTLAPLNEEITRVNEALARQDGILAGMNDAIARQDGILAELNDDGGSLSAITRLEQELELRQSEELRLANLIGVQEDKAERNNALIEEMNRVVARMQQQAADYDARLAELGANFRELDDTWKPVLMEASGKITPINDRLNTLGNAITKSDAKLQTLAADQTEMRDGLTAVSEEVRQARADLAGQMESWQVTIDEHKETVERFTQQWLTLSSQYKEARMAVQNFAHWQKQLEQQKREASEMLRVESNRMQSRWEGFLLEIQEQLKNVDLDLAQKWQTFELENEQRWVAARRNEQLWREELANVDDLIVKLQQDSRNLIWRVQSAQADAIKKWPRLLLEEVEKAVELNPNRRLQATTGAATARSDMSVADAIEQGLIKVDYDDDAADN